MKVANELYGPRSPGIEQFSCDMLLSFFLFKIEKCGYISCEN